MSGSKILFTKSIPFAGGAGGTANEAGLLCSWVNHTLKQDGHNVELQRLPVSAFEFVQLVETLFKTTLVSFSTEEEHDENEDMFERVSNFRAVVACLQLIDPVSFNLSDITLNLLCRGDPDTLLQLNVAIVGVYLTRHFSQLFGCNSNETYESVLSTWCSKIISHFEGGVHQTEDKFGLMGTDTLFGLVRLVCSFVQLNASELQNKTRKEQLEFILDVAEQLFMFEGVFDRKLFVDVILSAGKKEEEIRFWLMLLLSSILFQISTSSTSTGQPSLTDNNPYNDVTKCLQWPTENCLLLLDAAEKFSTQTRSKLSTSNQLDSLDFEELQKFSNSLNEIGQKLAEHQQKCAKLQTAASNYPAVLGADSHRTAERISETMHTLEDLNQELNICFSRTRFCHARFSSATKAEKELKENMKNLIQTLTIFQSEVGALNTNTPISIHQQSVTVQLLHTEAEILEHSAQKLLRKCSKIDKQTSSTEELKIMITVALESTVVAKKKLDHIMVQMITEEERISSIEQAENFFLKIKSRLLAFEEKTTGAVLSADIKINERLKIQLSAMHKFIPLMAKEIQQCSALQALKPSNDAESKTLSNIVGDTETLNITFTQIQVNFSQRATLLTQQIELLGLIEKEQNVVDENIEEFLSLDLSQFGDLETSRGKLEKFEREVESYEFTKIQPLVQKAHELEPIPAIPNNGDSSKSSDGSRITSDAARSLVASWNWLKLFVEVLQHQIDQVQIYKQVHQSGSDNIRWLRSQLELLKLISPDAFSDVTGAQQTAKRLKELNSGLDSNAQVLIRISEQSEELPSIELRDRFGVTKEGVTDDVQENCSVVVLIDPPSRKSDPLPSSPAVHGNDMVQLMSRDYNLWTVETVNGDRIQLPPNILLPLPTESTKTVEMLLELESLFNEVNVVCNMKMTQAQINLEILSLEEHLILLSTPFTNKLTDLTELKSHFATLALRCDAVGQEITELLQDDADEQTESPILTAKLQSISKIATSTCNNFDTLSGAPIQTEVAEEQLNGVLNEVAQIEDKIRDKLQEVTSTEVLNFWEDHLALIIQQLESCLNISIVIFSSTDSANDDENRDWFEEAAGFIGNLEQRLITCWDVCTAELSRQSLFKNGNHLLDQTQTHLLGFVSCSRPSNDCGNKAAFDWLKELTSQQIALDNAVLVLAENSKQIEELHNSESKEQFDTVDRLKQATDFCNGVQDLMKEVLTAEEKANESSGKAILDFEKLTELQAITDQFDPDKLLAAADFEIQDLTTLDDIVKVDHIVALEELLDKIKEAHARFNAICPQGQTNTSVSVRDGTSDVHQIVAEMKRAQSTLKDRITNLLTSLERGRRADNVLESETSDSPADETDAILHSVIVNNKSQTTKAEKRRADHLKTNSVEVIVTSPLGDKRSPSTFELNQHKKEILTGSAQIDSRKKIPRLASVDQNLADSQTQFEDNIADTKYCEVTRTYEDEEGNECTEKKYFRSEDFRISELVQNPEYEVTATNLHPDDVRDYIMSSSVVDTEMWAKRTMSSSLLNLDSFDKGERFHSVQNITSKVETFEEFVIEQETSTNADGEIVTNEKTYPLFEPNQEEKPMKSKSFENKDHIIEVTVVQLDENGQEVEETRRFKKGDPAIEDFVANREIISQQTFSGKFTRTVIEETRSEKVKVAEEEIVESSNTKISSRLEKEFFEESSRLDTSKLSSKSNLQINTSLKNIPESQNEEPFKVEMAGRIASLNSYDVNQVSLVVKGNRVQEKYLGDHESLDEVGVFEFRVFPNLETELSEQYLNPSSSDYWKLKDSGILPKVLNKGQSFSHTEMIVEVTIPAPGNDNSLEHVYIYKPHDHDLLEFLKQNGLNEHFDKMVKSAVLGISETGDTVLGNEAESSTDSDASPNVDVVVAVEYFEDLQGDLYVIVKFQSYMEKKVFKYPADDPELLEMVRNGTIPAESLTHLGSKFGKLQESYDDISRSLDSIPSSDGKSSEVTSDEELIEITNTEGVKQQFKLNDPELLRQVKGTDFEHEILKLRKSTSKVNLNRDPNRKRVATSQVNVRRKWSESSASSSSDSSEEEFEGFKVSLELLFIEDKVANNGTKYVHVTKIYRTEAGDELETQKQFEPDSSKIPKLRKRQAIINSKRKTKSHIDRLDLMPQIEFHLGSNSYLHRSPNSVTGKRPRLSTTRSERMVESPISKSMNNLQFEDYEKIEAENDVEINTWTFRAEEEITEDGERKIHLFENKFGDEIETVHSVDSPIIVELIELGELPESFLVPAPDDENEQVVQRKFMVMKRQMNENPNQDPNSNQQDDPLSKHSLRVEDAIDKESGDRLVLLTEQFTDELGTETLNQQIHRPASPTIVHLVDRGLIPASFLFEEPERDIIEEDEDGYFTENVVKRVYERVYSDFVEIPTSPRTWSSYDENEDLEWTHKKINPEDFDVCEAEMDVQEVKIIEEFYDDDSQNLFVISRRGRGLNGKVSTKMTRHRANSPTLKRYLRDGVPVQKLKRPANFENLTQITQGGHFLPYINGFENHESPYLNVNDPSWNHGKLISQQAAFLRFQESEILNQIYQSVEMKPLKGNAVKVASWLEPIDENQKSVVSVDALEQIDLSNQKIILLNKVIRDEQGNVFQEVRGFEPGSDYIHSLVDNNHLPQTVIIQTKSVSPYSILSPDSPTSGKVHRLTSERSQVLFETVKSRSPTNDLQNKKKTAKTILNIDENTFPGTLEERRSEKGDKFLNVTVIEPVNLEKNDVHVAKFAPKSVFIDQIVRYNSLPIAIRSALITSEGEIFDIKVPVKAWESGKDEALVIDTIEQEKDEKIPSEKFQSSLQKRVEAITNIQITAKKSAKATKEPLTSQVIPEKEEQIPFETYDQEVSIKTIRLRNTDLIFEHFPLPNKPSEPPIDTKGSKFISQVLRKFKGYAISEARGTPNNVEEDQENWNTSDPVALDVSEIVATKVSVIADEKNKKVSFYNDPMIETILPDIGQDFKNLPDDAQKKVDELMDRKLRNKKDPELTDEDQVTEEMIVKDTRVLESTPFEFPEDFYQVRGTWTTNDDDVKKFVTLKRELRDHDAEESRTYPSETEFISGLIKDGKLPELKVEEPVDVPAVDWMTSIVEVDEISITPLTAKQDRDNASVSSLGVSALSSHPVTNIQSSAIMSSPDVTNELESGYESVTPSQSVVLHSSAHPRQLNSKAVPTRVSEVPSDSAISEEVCETPSESKPTSAFVKSSKSDDKSEDYDPVSAVNRVNLEQEPSDQDDDLKPIDDFQKNQDKNKDEAIPSEIPEHDDKNVENFPLQKTEESLLDNFESGKSERIKPQMFCEGIAFAKVTEENFLDDKLFGTSDSVFVNFAEDVSQDFEANLHPTEEVIFVAPDETQSEKYPEDQTAENPLQYLNENSLEIIPEEVESDLDDDSKLKTGPKVHEADDQNANELNNAEVPVSHVSIVVTPASAYDEVVGDIDQETPENLSPTEASGDDFDELPNQEKPSFTVKTVPVKTPSNENLANVSNMNEPEPEITIEMSITEDPSGIVEPNYEVYISNVMTDTDYQKVPEEIVEVFQRPESEEIVPMEPKTELEASKKNNLDDDAPVQFAPEESTVDPSEEAVEFQRPRFEDPELFDVPRNNDKFPDGMAPLNYAPQIDDTEKPEDETLDEFGLPELDEIMPIEEKDDLKSESTTFKSLENLPTQFPPIESSVDPDEDHTKELETAATEEPNFEVEQAGSTENLPEAKSTASILASTGNKTDEPEEAAEFETTSPQHVIEDPENEDLIPDESSGPAHTPIQFVSSVTSVDPKEDVIQLKSPESEEPTTSTNPFDNNKTPDLRNDLSHAEALDNDKQPPEEATEDFEGKPDNQIVPSEVKDDLKRQPDNTGSGLNPIQFVQDGRTPDPSDEMNEVKSPEIEEPEIKQSLTDAVKKSGLKIDLSYFDPESQVDELSDIRRIS